MRNEAVEQRPFHEKGETAEGCIKGVVTFTVPPKNYSNDWLRFSVVLMSLWKLLITEPLRPLEVV